MKHIMTILISVFSLGYHGKTIDFEKIAPANVPRLHISSTKADGMMSGWKIYLKALLNSSSIKNPCGLENLCFALWMTPSLPKQSLRHGLCIRLKMRISTSPTSRESRTMDIRLLPSCSLAMALSLIKFRQKAHLWYIYKMYLVLRLCVHIMNL